MFDGVRGEGIARLSKVTMLRPGELKSERPNFVRPRVLSAATAHDDVAAAAPDAAAAAAAAAPPISYNVLSASHGACARCHVPLPLGGPMEDHVAAGACSPPPASLMDAAISAFLNGIDTSFALSRGAGDAALAAANGGGENAAAAAAAGPVIRGHTLRRSRRISAGGSDGAYGVRAAVLAPPAAAPAGLWNC
jgi:hypothetical protein